MRKNINNFVEAKKEKDKKMWIEIFLSTFFYFLTSSINLSSIISISFPNIALAA